MWTCGTGYLDAFDPSRDQEAFEEAWQSRAQGAVGEVHAFEPHYEGSGIVWASEGATSGARGSHRFEARPGHHLAPAVLRGGRNVFEELGPGFSLLVLDAKPGAVKAFRDAAAAMRLPFVVVECGDGGEPGRYAARMVLVRPDQFVAWTSDTADELSTAQAHQILSRAVGSLLGVLQQQSDISEAAGH